jgi:hypothetical protein
VELPTDHVVAAEVQREVQAADDDPIGNARTLNAFLDALDRCLEVEGVEATVGHQHAGGDDRAARPMWPLKNNFGDFACPVQAELAKADPAKFSFAASALPTAIEVTSNLTMLTITSAKPLAVAFAPIAGGFKCFQLHCLTPNHKDGLFVDLI